MQGKKLLKRGLLATAFVAALSFMTFGAAADAEARGCRGRGFYGGGGYYSAPVRYYGGPRYYSGYGPRYYGHGGYGYGYGRGGGFYLGGRNVAIGVGW